MSRTLAIACFAYLVLAVAFIFSGQPAEAETTQGPEPFEIVLNFTWQIWLVISAWVGLFNLTSSFATGLRWVERRSYLINTALVIPGIVTVIYVFIENAT